MKCNGNQNRMRIEKFQLLKGIKLKELNRSKIKSRTKILYVYLYGSKFAIRLSTIHQLKKNSTVEPV